MKRTSEANTCGIIATRSAYLCNLIFGLNSRCRIKLCEGALVLRPNDKMAQDLHVELLNRLDGLRKIGLSMPSYLVNKVSRLGELKCS
jgi:hypothetical protein